MYGNRSEEISVLDLPNKLKICREYAVLGLYKESLENYKKCLNCVEKYNLIINYFNSRLREISDSFLKSKWQDSRVIIQEEILTVNYLFELCSSFNANNIKKNTDDEDSNKFFLRENKQNNAKNINSNNNGKWEHFGGHPPFTNVNNQKEEKLNRNQDRDQFRYNENNNFSNDNERNYNKNINNGNNNDNYVAYKKPVINNNDKKDKDPDVWDPPEDYIKDKSNRFSNNPKKVISKNNGQNM